MGKSLVAIKFLFLTLFFYGSVAAQTNEVIQTARFVPLNLDTCELTYSMEYAQADSRAESRSLAVDGDKFYFSMGNAGKTVAFDGRQHWSKQANGRGALISKDKVAGSVQVDNHPLIMPYMWFWQDLTNAKWSDLRSKEMWDLAIKRMSFRDVKHIQGQECWTYEVAYSDENKFLVALGADGFPRQFELKRSGRTALFEVVKVARHSSGAIVATEIRRTIPEKSLLTILVNESKLKINEKVDPSIFSFDPSGVEELINIDKQSKRTLDTSTPNSMWVFLVTSFFAILSFIAYFIYRRKSS